MFLKFSFAALVAACATPFVGVNSDDAVWAAVDARNQAWVRNDREAYLSVHHPGYARWNRREMRLETKNDVQEFWDRVRQSERSLSIEVLPVSVQYLAEGRVAIAHYSIKEEVEFVGRPFVQRGDKRFEPGDTAVYRVRFSDIYELIDGKWRYLGGHKDGASLPNRGLIEAQCQRGSCTFEW